MLDTFSDLPLALQAMYAAAGIAIVCGTIVALVAYGRSRPQKGIEVFDADLDGRVVRIEVLCRGPVTPGTWVRARVRDTTLEDGETGPWKRLYAFREHGKNGDWQFSANGPRVHVVA